MAKIIRLCQRQSVMVPLVILVILLAVTSVFATTIYNLRVSGTTTLQGMVQAMRDNMAVYTNASSWTLTSTSYGKTYYCPGKAAQVVTLPANGAPAGSWMRFIGTGDNNYAPVFTAATNDTLIGAAALDYDTVTFGSGSRIGFALKILSNGTYWIAISEAGGITPTFGG